MGNTGSSAKGGKSGKYHGGGQATGYKAQQVNTHAALQRKYLVPNRSRCIRTGSLPPASIGMIEAVYPGNTRQKTARI